MIGCISWPNMPKNTISSGSSRVRTFDSTYTILGNIDIIKKEQKIIISTINEDFNNSPIVGYIKTSLVPGQQQQLQPPTLPNPFTNKATINQKIETEISSALSSIGNTNMPKFPFNVTLEWYYQNGIVNTMD